MIAYKYRISEDLHTLFFYEYPAACCGGAPPPFHFLGALASLIRDFLRSPAGVLCMAYGSKSFYLNFYVMP